MPNRTEREGPTFPAPVRREVWRRDRGCCSYVDPHSGRRCGSRFLLELDHIVPFALGGSAEPGDLRLHCSAHHRFRHREYGPPPDGATRSALAGVRVGQLGVDPRATVVTIAAGLSRSVG